MGRKRQESFDFGQFFHTSQYSPIDFQIRGGADGRHDAIYLGSYLHDARFKLADVRRQAKRLTIELQRDTWETYHKTGDMKLVACRLTVEPVASVRWRFGHRLASIVADLSDAELTIADLNLNTTRVNSALAMANPTESFEFEIDFADAWPSIRLRDNPL